MRACRSKIPPCMAITTYLEAVYPPPFFPPVLSRIITWISCASEKSTLVVTAHCIEKSVQWFRLIVNTSRQEKAFPQDQIFKNFEILPVCTWPTMLNLQGKDIIHWASEDVLQSSSNRLQLNQCMASNILNLTNFRTMNITNAFYTISSSRLGDGLVYINITYTKFISISKRETHSTIFVQPCPIFLGYSFFSRKWIGNQLKLKTVLGRVCFSTNRRTLIERTSFYLDWQRSWNLQVKKKLGSSCAELCSFFLL